MALKSSFVDSSCALCYPLINSSAKSILLLSVFFTAMVSCSKPDIAYSTHCASVVPESTPRDSEFTIIPFPPNQDGFFFGADGIQNYRNASRNASQHDHYSSSGRKTLLFQTHHVYTTDVDGVYKVEATLIIRPFSVDYYVEDSSYSYSYSPAVIVRGSQRGTLSFNVEGFWSNSSGKFCMVGLGTSNSPDGKTLVFAALLKLYGVRSSNSITSLVGGTLDSLSSAGDSNYFKTISLLIFPKINYKYSEDSKGIDYACRGGINVPKGASLSLPLSKPVCSIFSGQNSFELENANGCNSTRSCAPFGNGVGFLPQFMSLSLLQCSDDGHSLRFLLEFQNTDYFSYYQPFILNTTLVAEGGWDAKDNQLCAVACRISKRTESFNGSHVEDCSIRLSFRFPSVWSIKNTYGISGEIWTTKKVNDPGYFNSTMFHSQRSSMYGIPGLKYNYTLVDRARKSCPKKTSTNKTVQYPDGNAYDMQFDMSVKNSSRKRIGYGYGEPIFVGDQVVQWNLNSSADEKLGNNRQLNISYRMNLPSFNGSSNEYGGVQILAEGIYDAETGDLCMVGCRYVDMNNKISATNSMDCEILVTLRFPPVSSNNYIEGNIRSTRNSSDPLYFKSLSFTAVSPYSRYAMKSIWRMDLEIIMAVISNTLVCVFSGYQIWYVKKHPGVLPFLSLLMLVVLTLGHMFPLVLNFEALFVTEQNRRSFLLGTGEWLEVNEVLVRVLTMVAFVLQFRLLQTVWSARLANGNQKALWVAEKKTLCICLPLYIAGGLVALLVHWTDYDFGDDGRRSIPINGHQHSLWVDLRSYAGLILDGFLLPQILISVFHNSIENALSRFFYLGTTFVHLLPHAYDLYRAHYYNDDFNSLYMYANPSADYYSTAWDVIIPLGGLLFATIVHLQQRFGGRCFLPKRFKELEGYEKVPVLSEA